MIWADEFQGVHRTMVVKMIAKPNRFMKFMTISFPWFWNTLFLDYHNFLNKKSSVKTPGSLEDKERISIIRGSIARIILLESLIRAKIKGKRIFKRISF
jgi:hypothetical protein